MYVEVKRKRLESKEEKNKIGGKKPIGIEIHGGGFL